MLNNQHLYEKALAAHYDDLRLEMEKRRILIRPPKGPNPGRQAAGKLGLLLLKVGHWLKQLEYSHAVLEDRV